MITGIILASGFSKRMGKRDKLLMEIDGMKMVERVIESCKSSSLDRIILIYRTEEVKEIGVRNNIETFFNSKAYIGQSEALKLGVNKAKNSDAYMFLVGDQPFITSQLIDRLIDEYKNSSVSIVIPHYKNYRGTPTIFSAIYKEELLKIVGDKGGRDIIKKNPSSIKKVSIQDERLGLDIDDYSTFRSEKYGIR